MKFVLSCTQAEELPRYIDLIRENIPDMLETWIISGHNHVFEPDGTYTEIPFKYKEFVINLNRASDIVYFAQHIVFGTIRIRPFDHYVDWNTIILDDDAMKEIYTAPEIIIGI